MLDNQAKALLQQTPPASQGKLRSDPSHRAGAKAWCPAGGTAFWKMELSLQHVQTEQVLYLATDEVQTVEVFRKARLRRFQHACSRMLGASVGEGIAAWKPGQWHRSSSMLKPQEVHEESLHLAMRMS